MPGSLYLCQALQVMFLGNQFNWLPKKEAGLQILIHCIQFLCFINEIQAAEEKGLVQS